MWKQKIGISIGNGYKIPSTQVIKLIKQIGYEAVSLEWQEGVNINELVNTAMECGLIIQSLHAPFGKAADMWSKDKSINEPAKNELLSALNDCIKFNIPIMVVHTWIGFEYTFNETSLYFNNFEDVVHKAEQHNIKIAFENTEGEEYLFALMDHFKNNSTVGFCWDSGHELCYNHSNDLLAKFGDRLIMTHLNDNLGISRFDGNTFWTDDLHLLPYDGIADWDYNINRLKKSQHLDILNFELGIYSKPNRHENDIYGKIALVEYFTESYKRACKIAYNYSK